MSDNTATGRDDAHFYCRCQPKHNRFMANNHTRVATVRIWDHDSQNRERLDLSMLKSVLQEAPENCSCLEVVLCGVRVSPWRDLEESIWIQFCETLQREFQNLKSLVLHHPDFMGDRKCKILLQHLPSSLIHLEFGFVSEDLFETLQELGRSCSQLEELRVLQYRNLTVAGVKCLANSLQQMTRLKTITLGSIYAENVKDSMRPILDVVASKSGLETVNILDLWYKLYDTRVVPGTKWREPIYLTPEEKATLQFGPRLNKAKQDFLSGETITVQEFVNALIVVRDRVDCLDHLLSEVDPNLYAKHAIGEGHVQIDQFGI